MEVAATRAGKRVVESRQAEYYFPPDAVLRVLLRRVRVPSFCEWKGLAHHYDVEVGDRLAPRAAWSFSDPLPGYRSLQDWIGFYPYLMDACFVGGERVRPLPGRCFGGWVTRDIAAVLGGCEDHSPAEPESGPRRRF